MINIITVSYFKLRNEDLLNQNKLECLDFNTSMGGSDLILKCIF